MSFRASLAFASLALALTACGGGGGSGGVPGSGGSGSLVLELTDAPIDPQLVDAAVIEISAIRMHRDADGTSGFTTVFAPATPLAVDLAHLRGGITETLRTGLLEPGSYRQARLVVTDAYLRLKSGKEYSTRAGTIDLTSQDTSGYKVFFDPPVEVRANVETRVLLDFQLPKTFSPIPANDIENARTFHLHPLIRFAVLQQTGELRGVVTTTDDLGAVVPAAGAAVYVLDPGETDPDRAVASTLTDATGTAVILGVPTGTYDVRAMHLGKSGGQEGVVVTRNAVASFTIQVE